MDNWTTVTGWKGQQLGRIRCLSRDPVRKLPEIWIIEGRDTEFYSSSIAAMRVLLEGKGVRYQVKTMQAHRYWNGGRWTKSRRGGKVYQTRDEALKVAEALDLDKRTWDRVVVAEWEANNWR